MEPDNEIDCLGLFCPEPIFRTRTALDQMGKGEILKITTDDPAAEEDIKLLSKRLGHEVIDVNHDGDRVTLYIKK